MIERKKYFVFNKERDVDGGCFYHTRWQNGFQLDQTDHRTWGSFFSPLLDSQEKETQWHRLTATLHTFGEASTHFTFYTSEDRLIKTATEQIELGELIADPSIQLETKKRLLEPFKVSESLGESYMLLHQLKGRYLWFRIDLMGQESGSPRVTDLKIHFPKESLLPYLPEIYADTSDPSGFLERYLAIFQTLYDDMDRQIRQMYLRLDPDIASGPFLHWLASWIGIDDGHLWNEQQLRYLVKNAARIYRMRGTRSTVSELVALYTGEKPWIVERYQLDQYVGDANVHRLISNLYGDDSYMVTVVVQERCVKTQKQYKTLLKIIENAKPAHVEVNLVVLKPYVFLGRYSYLEINSVLGQYRSANLDGFSPISLTNLASSEEHDV